MARKLLAIVTAIAAALLLVGVSWAASDDSANRTSTTASTEGSSSTSTDDSTPDVSTSAGDDGSSTTSVHEDDDEDHEATGATLYEDDKDDHSSGTTLYEDDEDDDSTGTTLHEDDDEEHEDHEDGSTEAISDTSTSYEIPGVAVVNIAIVGGKLELGSVETQPGWDYEVKKNDSDKVDLKFRNGSDEAEFEAEVEHGKLKIEVETS